MHVQLVFTIPHGLYIIVQVSLVKKRKLIKIWDLSTYQGVKIFTSSDFVIYCRCYQKMQWQNPSYCPAKNILPDIIKNGMKIQITYPGGKCWWFWWKLMGETINVTFWPLRVTYYRDEKIWLPFFRYNGHSVIVTSGDIFRCSLKWRNQDDWNTWSIVTIFFSIIYGNLPSPGIMFWSSFQ